MSLIVIQSSLMFYAEIEVSFEGLLFFDSRHRYGNRWHHAVATDAEFHKSPTLRDLMRLLWRSFLLPDVLVIFFAIICCVCNVEWFRCIRNQYFVLLPLRSVFTLAGDSWSLSDCYRCDLGKSLHLP